jgi:hypothetical protein
VALVNSKVSSPVNAGGVAGTGLSGNITIPAGSFSTYGTGITTGATYTINTGAGSWGTTVSTNHPSLHVTGDAEFEGNVKIKGKDLAKSLEAIEKRLAILVPDPNKLEKFEALQKAYAHYKLLEALCNGDDDDK